MLPQLMNILSELDAATARAKAVAERAGDERWTTRPAPSSWSVGECIDHLNRSSEVYFPLFEQALSDAPEASPRRLRRDFFGWLLCMTLEPPVRMKVKTADRFVPPPDIGSRREVMDRFEALQDRVRDFVARSDGVDVARIKLRSPFAEKLKYSMYSALRIIPVHQRRHLWQAERALEVIEASGEDDTAAVGTSSAGKPSSTR
jgi:hypothetical protein